MHFCFASQATQPAWDAYVMKHPQGCAYQLYAWKEAVKAAYGFDGHYLMAQQAGEIVGVLPMVAMHWPFRGKQLVSLPYCDVGGALANSDEMSAALLNFSLHWAGDNGFGVLELRCRQRLPAMESMATMAQPLELQPTHKVRMLLELPQSRAQLMTGFKAKLRSQIKKPLRDGLTAQIGGNELLDLFYAIFAHNMRDLGSPVHSRELIRQVLLQFGDQARLVVVFTPLGIPAAAALMLVHRHSVSVPWASALKKYNSFNPNMLLYWTMLGYAVDHGVRQFDFGRSTVGSGTYKFKEQWGAQPQPLLWVRGQLATAQAPGSSRAAHSNGPLREVAEQTWQRLPLWLCNSLGPALRRYISL